MVDRPTHDPLILAKSVLWEEAKGKLLAMVAVDGSKYSNAYDEVKCQAFAEAVANFIREIEQEEWQM